MNKSLPIEDFASPPGDTLSDTLEALGMIQTELAERTGLSAKTVSRIINGIDPITHETALALENVLNIPANFWLRLESNYREHLARVEASKKIAQFEDWARRFPYPRMVEHGFLRAAKTAQEKAQALLLFFGVASPEQWHGIYEEMELSFRRTERSGDTIPAISAWLRQGEILSQSAQVGEFNEQLFSSNLREIRKLTCLNPGQFVPRIKELCADAGVVYELVPELPGLGVYGVMRWFHKRPLIQQSLLLKTNDIFWFTFFHEAKHVLQMRKKKIFVEGAGSDAEHLEHEEEANRFAQDILIPANDWKAFVKAGNYQAMTIQRFSESIEIHPGITTGRLLREKLISFVQPQANLRANFQWVKSA
jgi:addiction module HigA family antidote